MPTSSPLDVAAIKERQHGAWSSGDYAAIGTTLQLTGELLCEAADVTAGERVLDVAAGNGNAALAAARRGAVVTASDYVAELLDRAAARAAADGVELTVREADAEALPFADASFDVVVSTFGVMFTPRQEVAAAELCRVCRPGGRIGLASWTPTGFVGRMFGIVGRYVPPPTGIRSPLEWGSRARLEELFADRVVALTTTSRRYVFRYRSAQHWLDAFRTTYGPVLKAFAALEPDAQDALAAELIALATVHNTATGGALRVPSEYLEAIAVVADGRR